jgi:hypothetical protein
MAMSSLRSRTVRIVAAAAAAVGLLVAPAVTIDQSVSRSEARPCVNGVIPGNPWAESCNFGPRGPKVRGGAPDQTAVIACRDIPGCLSWYVNGPW